MAVFANFALLVADQTGTTLTQADADILETLVDKMLTLDYKVGPIFKDAITVEDDEGAVTGESRVAIIDANADVKLDITILSLGKVEARLSALRNSVRADLQRITTNAVFSYSAGGA